MSSLFLKKKRVRVFSSILTILFFRVFSSILTILFHKEIDGYEKWNGFAYFIEVMFQLTCVHVM